MPGISFFRVNKPHSHLLPARERDIKFAVDVVNLKAADVHGLLKGGERPECQQQTSYHHLEMYMLSNGYGNLFKGTVTLQFSPPGLSPASCSIVEKNEDPKLNCAKADLKGREKINSKY